MAVSRFRRRGTGSDTPQVVEIVVANGYHPNVLEVPSHVPLRLVFRRLDSHECSDRVVFSEPRLVRHLAPGAETTIDLPAAGPGEVRFTCGMGRYRGRIVRRSGSGRRASWAIARGPWPWAVLIATLAALVAWSIVAGDLVAGVWLVLALATVATTLILLRARALPNAAHHR